MNHTTHDRDTILDEIHGTRERIAAKFGGDVTAILEDARKRQAASGRALWQLVEKARAAADESTT